MKKNAYGKPIIISKNQSARYITKMETVSEQYIQDLIFDHPECLPVSDIDETYNPVVPVCKELNTPAGPIDAFMITPNGGITIIETKLWRNSEARRKVIAQILDYAKELTDWTYDDLQRELNRKLNSSGNVLYELAKAKYPDQTLSESDFFDSVTRNLSRGKFLLLIVGDGIREGALSITQFLSNSGQMNFTFAMVEMNVFEDTELGSLIIPKTIVKTIDIPKLSIELPDGFKISPSDTVQDDISETGESTELEEKRNFYRAFWSDFIENLSFDDPGQPMPTAGKGTNLYVYPCNSKRVWISAYIMKSDERVGVYFRTQKDEEGQNILEILNEDLDGIKEELGEDVNWEWNDEVGSVGIRLYVSDVFAEENKEKIHAFFQKWLNTFVNVFRPRLKRL